MPAPALGRNLWYTSPMQRGDDVLMLQRRLAALGFKLDQDGLFGRGTADAVRGYQERNGLSADGVVGPATWGRLFGLGGDQSQAVLPPLVASDILTPDKLTRLRARHGYFKEGCRWSLTKDGVLVDEETIAVSGPAEMKIVSQVFASFAQPLSTVLVKIQVPVEVVVACICTESGGSPNAKRLEPGGDTVNSELTPSRVSWGLTQTLLSTARSALRRPDLPLADLLIPEVSIRAGATYMWTQARATGFDPPLVAAAYNAGGLYYNDSTSNRWRLRQYPIGTSAHVDRFLRLFNAAMAVVSEANLPPEVPSFRRLLAG